MVATSATLEVDRETIGAARLLSRAAVFSGVGASCLVELAGHSVTRYVAAGDHLFHQGEFGTSMYVLGEGHVRLYVDGPDGVESALAVLGPGSAWGELAFCEGGSRSASAVAIEPCSVVSLAGPDV